MTQDQYIDSPKPLTLSTRLLAKRDGNNIIFRKEYGEINKIIKTHILEIGKLQDRMILDNLTTKELKGLKKLINEILKERASNGE